MLKTLIALTLAGGTCIAHAQARPTASRLAEAQVGGSYVSGQSDYSRNRFNGFGFYADLDFRQGFGAEAAFHYISDSNPTGIYERTYEIGGRYSRHYRRFQPYGKLLVGRGVFNFPSTSDSHTNLAYNLFAFGGGTDYRILPNINVRVEYEAQKWLSGPLLDNGLSPNLLSVGVAYHFK